MSREEDLLKRVYAGFNSRDIDDGLAALHADVMWVEMTFMTHCGHRAL